VGWLTRPLDWLLARRRRALEAVWRDPQAVQEETLLRLVGRARRTEWGRAHGYAEVRGLADYLRRVPVGQYLDFRPLWQRAIDSTADVTWPGRPRYFAKTSGTTAGDKSR
jgi:GH3 auxin-responsive promoter